MSLVQLFVLSWLKKGPNVVDLQKIANKSMFWLYHQSHDQFHGSHDHSIDVHDVIYQTQQTHMRSVKLG